MGLRCRENWLKSSFNLEWGLDFFFFFFCFFFLEVGLIVYMILSNNILLQRYHCILHDSGLDSIPLGSH